jgi:hypothetical protein
VRIVCTRFPIPSLPFRVSELKIDFCSDRNTQIHIKADGPAEQTAVITSQVYQWTEKVLIQGHLN